MSKERFSANGRLKVAVLGCGQWGRNYVRLLTEMGGARLAWVVDPDPRARELARNICPSVRVAEHLDDTGYDFDAAIVCTPATGHPHHARTLLLADKDVLVEKPLAMDARIAADLVQMAFDRRKVLMVGHQLLYHPAFKELRRQLRSGAIGQVISIRSERGGIIDRSREPHVIWSYGPHDVTMVLALAEQDPDRIRVASEVDISGVNSREEAKFYMGFPSGIEAEIALSGSSPARVRKLQVIGTQGEFVFDDRFSGGRLDLYPRTGSGCARADGRPIKIESYEPLARECEHFVDCVENRKEPRSGGNHALSVTRVLEKVFSGVLIS